LKTAREYFKNIARRPIHGGLKTKKTIKRSYKGMRSATRICKKIWKDDIGDTNQSK
jgi:hypothetical protein